MQPSNSVHPQEPGPATSRKDDVRTFWNQASCGEVYAVGDSMADQLAAQARARYDLEPYLPEFARFADATGRDVLEIGVGMGADHLELAKSGPRSLVGVDLTERAVALTRQRLAFYGLSSDVRVGDAEALALGDESFDLVYSWGVLHHSPDTARAVNEVWRVLRPGGRARIMIYHKWSLVGLMLWMRFALLHGRPHLSLDKLYAQYLESPGTKAYTVAEATAMFTRFRDVRAWSRLSFGDLLQGEVGQRHQGMILSFVKRAWPRWLIRRTLGRFGLAILIDATK